MLLALLASLLLVAGAPAELPRVGLPGPVAVWGEAEPLAASGSDVVVATGRFPDGGRIVLLGHDGYLANEPVMDWAKSLAGGDVRVVHGGRAKVEDLPALREHLEAGGGLVVAATGWGWEQITGGDVADLPVQDLLWPAGLAITDQTLRSQEPIRTGDLPVTLNATVALERLENGTAGDPAGSAAVLIRALPHIPDRPEPRGERQQVEMRAELEALAEGDLTAAIADLGREPAGEHEHALARVALAAWTHYASVGRIHVPPDHPVARHFPGDIGPDAVSDTVRMTIDLSIPGWHSTGFYAMPRDYLRVAPHGQVPPGLRIRIGAHSDELWHKETWRRPPQVTVEHPVDADIHGSIFGGPVYVVVPPGLQGTFDLSIGGSAVLMPRFVLGETDPADWRETIRHYGAPWAELECESLVITLPSSAIRDLDDPTPILEHWERVQQANARLAGQPLRRDRFVNDIQISAGYMHAGYPIMTHLDVAEKQLDLGWLKSTEAWGFYHELGHNHQRPVWTWAGMTEVTCNLFTLYVLETVCGLSAEEAAHRVLTGRTAERVQAHLAAVAAGENSSWTDDPFLALGLFVELRLAFGWAPFKAVFAEYEAMPRARWPGSTQDRVDGFVTRFSRAAGRDVSPRFLRWGVAVTPEAVSELDGLPDWSGERP